MSQPLIILSALIYAYVAIEQMWLGNVNFGGMYLMYCGAAIFASRMTV